MAINIKNPRAVDAVKRLSEHYGTNYAKAIELAADVALSMPGGSAEERALERLERITAAYRADLPASQTLDADALYDQNGLYR
ncbi:MAG: type II toxin-antitoxin system VapB family antitoxin [Bifidobacteriaceae bacterium]|jgi:hypothetical protein|nr:type II toxin-antitoxin system VapB family antitoxin [Bifidobacteriaceae bacterium]